MPARIYTTCQLPGCSNPHYAVGLCRGHYVSQRNAATRAASYPITAQPAPPSNLSRVPPAPPSNLSQPAPFYATAAQRDARDAQRAMATTPQPFVLPHGDTPNPAFVPSAPQLPAVPVDWPVDNAARAFGWADVPAPPSVPPAPVLPASRDVPAPPSQSGGDALPLPVFPVVPVAPNL